MHGWLRGPGMGLRTSERTVSFGSGPRCDWFRDPRTGSVTADAPVYLIWDGAPPVTLSCLVRSTMVSTFDAAALFVHYDDEHWVKLAVERSPSGEATVVSVRTAGWSDDCNHVTLTAPECALRVSLDERSVALHAAIDAAGRWDLVRYCGHPSDAPPSIGLLVQSPTGNGATGTFRALEVEPVGLADVRDGS